MFIVFLILNVTITICLLYFRYLKLIISHEVFGKDEHLHKFLLEKEVSYFTLFSRKSCLPIYSKTYPNGHL
jgi:hypothetical protein